MLTARRLLIGCGVLLGGGALWLRAGSREAAAAPVAPSEGALARFDAALTGPWREAGRLPADVLGPGPVADVAVRGDTIYLLQRDRWFRVVEGRVSGPFGGGDGGPGPLMRAVSLAATAEGVVILDRARHRVSWWGADGALRRERDVRVPGGRASFPEAVEDDGRGGVYVSTRLVAGGGAGAWIVLRFGADGAPPDTAYRAPTGAGVSGSFDTPHLAPAPDGAVVIAPAMGWRFRTIAPDGTPRGEATRRDGPRWSVPDSIRRRYARTLAGLPPAERSGLELPDAFPPVRAVGAAPGGGFLVLVAAGPDAVHAERLDADARPRGRLWREAETAPVFLSGGAVLRLRETLDHTLLERQDLTPSP